MFIDDQRQHNLDLLHHLHDDTNDIVVIEGEDGVGKTTFLQHYAEELSGRETVCLVSCDRAASLRVNTQRALAQLYPSADDTHSATELDFVRTLQRAAKSKPITLLLDNVCIREAEDARFLSFLNNVKLEQPCHVVLAGPPGTHAQLSGLLTDSQLSVTSRTITLLPFSEQSCLNFVSWLNSHREGTPAPKGISNEALFKKTGGNAKQIVSLIMSDIDLVAPAQKRRLSLSSSQFIYGSAAVLTALFFVLMWLSAEPNGATPEQSQHPSAQQNTMLSEIQPSQSEAKVTLPHATTTVPERTTSATLPNDTPALMSAPPKPAFKREPWLLDQAPNRYTWQLITNEEESAVREFIVEFDVSQQAAYYRKFARKRPLYAVVFGIYPNIQAAESALEALPAGLKVYKPWRRTLREVQQEIYDYRTRTNTTNP